MYNEAKKILNVNDDYEQLSERCEEVTLKTEQKLAREITTALKLTMEKEGKIALSAPEIGYNKRIFCLKFDVEIKTFINPVAQFDEKLQLVKEQSNTDDRTYIRPRCSEVTLFAMRPTGQPISTKLIGKAALYAQQCLDTLDGVNNCDGIGLEVDEDFDNATEEEQDAIIKMYLDSLDLLAKNLDELIKNDKELKEISDATDFMTSVAKGETKLESI